MQWETGVRSRNDRCVTLVSFAERKPECNEHILPQTKEYGVDIENPKRRSEKPGRLRSKRQPKLWAGRELPKKEQWPQDDEEQSSAKFERGEGDTSENKEMKLAVSESQGGGILD